MRKLRTTKATHITENKSLLTCWEGEFYVLCLSATITKKQPVNETPYRNIKSLRLEVHLGMSNECLQQLN